MNSDLIYNAKRELSRREFPVGAEGKAYLALALQAVTCAKSAADLRQWFADERDHRLQWNILPDSDECETIVDACARQVDILKGAKAC